MRNKRYLMERDLNEEDTKEMFKWLAIFQCEVERVANVCAYYAANPLTPITLKSQRD